MQVAVQVVLSAGFASAATKLASLVTAFANAVTQFANAVTQLVARSPDGQASPEEDHPGENDAKPTQDDLAALDRRHADGCEDAQDGEEDRVFRPAYFPQFSVFP